MSTLRKRFALGLILAAVLVLFGCKKSSNKAVEKEEEGPKSNPILPQPGQVVQGGGAVQEVRRAVRRTVDLAELRGFALAYQQHALLNGQGPKSLDDLKGSVTPNLAEAIKEGHCVVVWEVRNSSSNTVIAYVKEPDIYGNRVVAKGDGTAVRMKEAEFQAAVKGQ
jgi:hypothetical protein